MPVKSGYLSLHNGGTGQQFEVAGTTRQYVTFPNAVSQEVMTSDRAITFVSASLTHFGLYSGVTGAFAVSTSLNLYPSESYSASVTSSFTHSRIDAVVQNIDGLQYWQISGSPVVPSAPFALNVNGQALDPVPHAGYGIRVGLWDALTGGTFRENVQFTNRDTPFTVTTVTGSINFAAGALAVTSA